MRNIFSLVKNDINLFIKNKFIIFVLLFGVPITIWLGFIFSSDSHIIRHNVAICIENDHDRKEIVNKITAEPRLAPVIVNEEVDMVDLVNGKYLAGIGEVNGSVEIKAINNNIEINSIRKMLGENVRLPADYISAQKKITGLLLIFMFMISKLLMGNHFENRENGILFRMLTGSVKYRQYASAQIIANLAEVYIPVVFMTLLMHLLFMKNMGWNIGYMCFIEFLAAGVGTSISFCFFNLFDKRVTVEFVSSMFILISSILGGCIIDIKDSNVVIKILRLCFPQKNILILSEKFQMGQVIYLTVGIAVMIGVGVVVGEKRSKEE